MSQSDADRHVLFGILAYQANFIDIPKLVNSVTLWTSRKEQALAQILVDQGALLDSDRRLLEQMVDRHIEMNGGSPEESLCSISSTSTVQTQLAEIEDSELEQSLAKLDITKSERSQQDSTISYVPHGSTKLNQRFELIRPHAEGGLGRVSIALDHELNREVALKEIRSDLSHDPTARNRFTQEAEITGGLEHPGIVPVYGLGTRDDGQPFYAMRFIRGGSLKDAAKAFHKEKSKRSISENAIEFRRLLQRFIDVCNAIEYAHSRGVLHRDLKPGNIMLGKYGETLVVDWGLAKAVGRKDEYQDFDEETLRPSSSGTNPATQFGEALGTPRFMSPEQANGKLDELGATSDVYSLGATLYYLLVNRPPFSEANAREVLQNVQQGEFESPRDIAADVPEALNAVCVKAMAKSPQDRYSTPTELSAEIQRWLADEAVEAMDEPLRMRMSRVLRRNSGAFLAAAISLLIVTISSIVAIALIEHARQSEKIALDQTRSAFLVANQQISAYPEFVSDFIARSGENDSLSPMRDELLGRALSYYRSFIDEYGTMENLEHVVAEAQSQLARVHEERGEKGAAIEDLRAAIQRWQQLVNSGKDVDVAGFGLASAHAHLARVLDSLGRYKESDLKFELTIKELRGRTQSDPQAADSLELLAGLQKDFAASKQGRGDFEAAEELYLDSQTNYETLVSNWRNAEYKSGLAALYSNMGIWAAIQRQGEQAKEQFENAIDLGEEILKSDPDNDEFRYEIGGYFMNLARTHRDLANNKESERFSRRAIDEYQSLVDEHPGLVRYRAGLVHSQSNFANFLRDIDRRQEALELYQEADSHSKLIAASQSAVPEHYQIIARLNSNWGRLLDEGNETQLALARYKQARDLRKKLVDDYPESNDFRRGLGLSENGLGTALLKSGNESEAEACFLRSNEAFDYLLKQNSDIVSNREGKSWAQNKMGWLRLTQSRWSDAQVWMEDCVASRRWLVDKEPEVVEHRNTLGGALNDLAWAHAEQGNLSDALKYYSEAIDHQEWALERNPQARRFRQYLHAHYTGIAEVHLELEDPQAALSKLQSCIELWPTDGDRVFACASLLASAWPKTEGSAAEPKSSISEAELVVEVEKALQQAEKAGWKSYGDLKADPNFEAILERPEIAVFLNKLNE